MPLTLPGYPGASVLLLRPFIYFIGGRQIFNGQTKRLEQGDFPIVGAAGTRALKDLSQFTNLDILPAHSPFLDGQEKVTCFGEQRFPAIG